MPEDYVPERGDGVWLDFSPQLGHERAGHRPALVLTPSSYNGVTGLMVACPITNQRKGYPFEVPLSGASDPGKITGVVLADRVKSLDWCFRQAEKAVRVKRTVQRDVIRLVGKLLTME